jgi:hypothetical protein
MKHGEDVIERVPDWLWRAAVGALVFVIAAGLALAVWLGTRPGVTGTPAPIEQLGAWTFGPGATGERSESGAELTLRTKEANRVVYAASQSALDDFTVQVRARLASGPDDAGYGLVVRSPAPDDFVAVFIGPDGYIAIGQMASGAWRWRVPWQQWPHIKRGPAENLLRAQCRADRCRFTINDELAFEVDGVPTRGQLGPAVWNPAQGENVSAVFREWQVWK